MEDYLNHLYSLFNFHLYLSKNLNNVNISIFFIVAYYFVKTIYVLFYRVFIKLKYCLLSSG